MYVCSVHDKNCQNILFQLQFYEHNNPIYVIYCILNRKEKTVFYKKKKLKLEKPCRSTVQTVVQSEANKRNNCMSSAVLI